ncbi:hypothetical protein BDC45DRAFT_573349 [Circinella umbellata]|nr:hypothetical protein BDC45DRAFT_573349 [Circinella umbellata]
MPSVGLELSHPSISKEIDNVVLMTNNNNNSTMNPSNGSLPFLTNNSNEEISTIFVVGFPDDMQEREFQNMFIFSPGFEAATLKIPSIKDQEEDITSPTTTTSAPPSSTTTTNTTCSSFSNNNNGRKQIIGFAKFRTRFEALEAKDILSGRRVDAEKGSVLKAEMAKKNLHTKRGLSSDQPISQQQPQQQQQQHPPPPPPPSVPMSTSSYPIISQHQQQQQQQHQQQQQQQQQHQHQQQQQQQQQQPSLSSSKRFSLGPLQAPSAAYEAFHSVPPALPSDLVPPNELSYPDYYPDLFSPGGTPIAPSFHESVFASRAPPPPPQQSFLDTRSASMGDIFNVKPSMSSSRLPSGFNPGHRFSSKSNILDMDHPKSPTERSNVFGAPMFLPPPPPPPLQQQQHHQQSTSSTSTPVPTSSNSQQQQALHSSTINTTTITTTTNSFLPQHPTAITPHQQQQFSSPPPPTATGGLNSVLEEVYPLQLPDPENNSNDLSSRLGGLSISTSSALPTNNNHSNHGSGFTSPTGITSPTSILSPTTNFRHFGVLGINTNPADQNPPCNTLYVGNLPPNANEEELKTMFFSCVGYQRLSFRNKSNGPMCFVEFEDISCASKAMQDLYGSPLSNSVKGGIRLSFSKNPLGVRQNVSTLEQ